MTGPKHLWSGDWESESARPTGQAPPLVFDSEPEPEPAATVGRVRRWSRRQIAIALTTGVAAAAVTVGLVSALGGSNTPKHHRLATAPTATIPRPTGGAAPTTGCQQTSAACGQATPVVSGPTADWMGMQLVSSPSGVVISTVRPGSIADQAGFEPGDEIEQLDGHPIDSVQQIRDVTARVALGKPVSIQVLRGSAIPQAASMPMTERPTIHP